MRKRFLDKYLKTVGALLLVCGCSSAFSQVWTGEAALQGGYTSGSSVPLWMRARQFGSIPIDGASGSVFAKIERIYVSSFDTIVWKPDYSVVFDGRGNIGNRLNGQLIEGKVSLKYGFFELIAGREKEYSGLVDSTLSTGSFSLSGNSLGVPKIELRIPNYVYIPFTSQVVSFKGNLSHGWMGKTPIHYGDNRGAEVTTYLHHVSVFGRIGKPTWRLKLDAAINHDVQWGSDNFIFGEQYDLTNLEAFWYVVTGKAYKGAGGYDGRVDISKIGNHLGTIDLGFTYDFEELEVKGYRQFFYEKGALRYAANIRDGITGLRFQNKGTNHVGFYWDKILLEHFFSKDQAGQPNAPKTPSGPEYYYNHGVYAEGFSYKGIGLGNPLITEARFAREGLPRNPKDYFISTRVSAFHLGFIGGIDSWHMSSKVTFARHFGDYHTSGPAEQWFNGQRIQQDFSYGKFTPVNQFSFFVEGGRSLMEHFDISATLAGDYGRLLENTVGGFVRISRKF
ncbi:capsule assembly Wzi family protein [Sphingobacterium griseoflavum]|nr:capsule assembly Wzi family protein [Sphingobacterium griseoflavum]